MAKLLSLNIPNKGDAFIRDDFKKAIEAEYDFMRRLTEPFPEDEDTVLQKAYDMLLKCYTEHRNLLDKVKLPLSEELKNKTLISDAMRLVDLNGTYFSFIDRVVISASVLGLGQRPVIRLRRSDNLPPEVTIFEEWLHRISRGFFNKALNEGTTWILIINTSPLLYDFYKNRLPYYQEYVMTSELAEKVPLETLLKAYSLGSYEPLKDRLDKVIELFELHDLVKISSTDYETYEEIKKSILQDFGANDLNSTRDPLTLLIWRSRENKTVLSNLSNLKLRLTDYLYGRRP